MKKIFLIGLLSTLAYTQQGIVTIGDNPVVIKSDEVVVEVLGMVCSFCAYGLEEGLSNVNGVDKKKYENGLYIDIDSQYVKIATLEDKTIDLDKIALIIRDAGFEANTIFKLKEKEVVTYKLDKSNKMIDMNHDHDHTDHNHNH